MISQATGGVGGGPGPLRFTGDPDGVVAVLRLPGESPAIPMVAAAADPVLAVVIANAALAREPLGDDKCNELSLIASLPVVPAMLAGNVSSNGHARGGRNPAVIRLHRDDNSLHDLNRP